MKKLVILALAVALLISGSAIAQELTIDPAISGDRARLKAIQTNLNAIGINVGKADGIFGRGSTAGLILFLEQFRPGTDYVLDAAVEALLAKVATSYIGDPWARSSDYGGISGAPVESTWDVSDQIKICAQRKCQAIPSLLATGDLTGDGQDELVFALSITDAAGNDRKAASPIVIMSPTGGGHYEPLSVKADTPEAIWRILPRFAVIRDFNGDGLGDLFIAAHGYDHPPFPGEQNVLLLSGPDGLVDVSSTNIPIQDDFAHGVNAGDLDGDGDLDLVVITNLGETRIDNYVLWNDGQGKFTQAGLDTILDESLALFLKRGMEDRSKYLQLKIEDLDKDGNLDLLLLNSGDNPKDAAGYPGFHFSRIVYGDGSGKWSRANAVQLPRPRWGVSTHTTDAALVDVDSDGDTDLILGEAGINTSRDTVWRGTFLQVLRNEGRSFVDVTHDYMFPQGYENEDVRFPHLVMPVDINQDGRMDIVVSSEAPWNPCSETESWRAAPVMLAQSDGTFLPLDSRRVGIEECSAWNLVAVDADGDGDIDIASGRSLGEVDSKGNFRSFGLRVQTYLNDPSRKDLPPKPEFMVRTRQGLDEFPDDTTQVGISLSSFVDALGDDFNISFDMRGRVSGGNITSLKLLLGDPPLGDGRPLALDKCGTSTEVWDDGKHHLVIGFARSDQAFIAFNMDCIVDALREDVSQDVSQKAAFLVDHFRDIAVSIATASSERPVTNINVLSFMRRVADGEITVSR